MARAFDHHLHIMLPGNLRQLPKCLKLRELCFIIRIRNAARAKAVAKREGDIISLHNFADFFKMRIQEVLLMMRQTPGCHNRAAAGDNSGHALRRKRDIAQQHPSMNREVIYPLLSLLDERIAVYFPVQVLGLTIHFLQGLIDRYGSNRNRGITHDPLPGGMNVLACRQIHNRIRAPAGCPGHLLNFLFNGRAHSRVPDIGINLNKEITANNHRLALRVIDITWNNRSAACHFVTNKLGRHVLTDRNILHLRRDDPLTCIVHLGYIMARLRPERTSA
ncbi:hypothetical protein D3C72_1144500 [compost metagenome]